MVTSGHGWIQPSSDGTQAKCGGPQHCQKCRAEADALGISGSIAGPGLGWPDSMTTQPTGTPLHDLGAHLHSNGATLRALNAVMRYGTYQTIEQVDVASDEDLLDRRNLGHVGLIELRDAIRTWKRSQGTADGLPDVHVWVATEFSIDGDGGRAWIQAASTCETAKKLCVEHLNRNGDPIKPRTLTWSDDRGAKWMFGQDTEVAYVDGHEYYEVRRVEVTGQ